MPRVAYFDCPSGAAGDMILGALVDAGVPFEALRAALATLGLPGYTLERREVMKGAFRATKVEVHLHDHDHTAAGADHDHTAAGADHDHTAAGADHDHAASGADHAHDVSHAHDHPPARGLVEILAIVEGSGLAPAVKAQAARIFRRLAEAEARVHGTSPEAVHFHEVGAVDAIVDVTGACAGLHLLGVETVHCSALPIGGGFVRGAHGRIPVPAPGTAELLRGFPVVDTGVRRELVTPTGAAILTTLARSAGAMPAMTVDAIGYGAGTMDLETPNVVRVLVGAARDEADGRESIVQLETTIDDMSPQLYEPLLERLLEAGAVDAFLTPVVMKRSRPGVVLTALCPAARVDELGRILFEETTTIGVRWTPYQRRVLPREMVTLDTMYGPVPFKVSRLAGRPLTATPEFEAVRRLARDKGLPVREVLDAARTEGRRLLDPGGWPPPSG